MPQASKKPAPAERVVTHRHQGIVQWQGRAQTQPARSALTEAMGEALDDVPQGVAIDWAQLQTHKQPDGSVSITVTIQYTTA